MDSLPNAICINLDEIAQKEVLEAAFLEEFRRAVRRLLSDEKGFTRILTNAVYMAMYRFIDKCSRGTGKELIKERVYAAIKETPYYYIFRDAESFRGRNEAYSELMDVVKESRAFIKERVETIISEYPFNELKHDEIGDVIYDCIMDRLFGKIGDAE